MQMNLPLVRTFLLGYFREVTPEKPVTLPTTATGKGKIDFLIDDVAVEFAVRTKSNLGNNLSRNKNFPELVKLLSFKGKSLLVLYDFSPKPYSSYDIEEFRNIPYIPDCHEISPFNVSYFFQTKNGAEYIRKLIRVNTSRNPRLSSCQYE